MSDDFILVEDRAPRSGKVTLYICRLGADGVYTVESKPQYREEAVQRVAYLNSVLQKVDHPK